MFLIEYEKHIPSVPSFPLLIISTPMRIIVRQIQEANSDLPTFSVEVTVTSLVRELQQHIQQLISLEPSSQRLMCFYHGVKVLLASDWPLGYYKLEDGSNVFLTDVEMIEEEKGRKGDERAEEREGEYLCKVIKECKRGSLSGLKRWLTDYCLRTAMKEEDDQLIDKLGPGGWGCIHYSAYSGSSELLAYLLDLGADVNKESHDGWTPLQLAVSRGHVDCTF